MVTDESTQLVDRVSRGALRREALELLSSLGHADARRALTTLPLELASHRPARWVDDGGPPAGADRWLGVAAIVRTLDRRVAVEIALGMADALAACFDDELVTSPGSLAGLYTGPAGAVILSEREAKETFPLARACRRAVDGARAWLASPTDAAGDALAREWPPLLGVRLRAELCAELAEVSWQAVWAHHWLLRCVIDPEPSAALACVIAYAEEALPDPARAPEIACAAAAAALLAP